MKVTGHSPEFLDQVAGITPRVSDDNPLLRCGFQRDLQEVFQEEVSSISIRGLTERKLYNG